MACEGRGEGPATGAFRSAPVADEGTAADKGASVLAEMAGDAGLALAVAVVLAEGVGVVVITAVAAGGSGAAGSSEAEWGGATGSDGLSTRSKSPPSSR
jgi:hypothetical protein